MYKCEFRRYFCSLLSTRPGTKPPVTSLVTKSYTVAVSNLQQLALAQP
jgi:hypothetical protein